jgi:hypothetical protein
MKQILAEAEKELEQASPLKQQQEEEEQEKVENVQVVEEQEEEEVRRASVSTVELDDTETHILPSASFLGRYLHSFFSVSVLWILKYLCRIRIIGSLVLNKGQGGQIIRVQFRILPGFMVIEKKYVVK